MRSTHACTPSFATFHAIFTSVVVYSRTTTKKPTKKTHSGLLVRLLVFFVGEILDYNILNLIRIQQKKMRSTHACTPSFAHFSLNIHGGCCLFSHDLHKKTNKHNSRHPSLLLSCLLVFDNYTSSRVCRDTIAQLCIKRKKNAEHTRMLTNFFTHFLLNIHVGCCLFSHDPKTNKT